MIFFSFLLRPSCPLPSLRPDYICGVTADAIWSLPLWKGDGTISHCIFFTNTLHQIWANIKSSSDFLSFLFAWKILASPTTVKYKKRASQCSGGHSCAQRYDSCEDRGRNNLYDWIPSSPNVFPSSPTWGAHSSKCLFRKIKLWGRRRNWGSLWKFGHAGGGVSCKN